jgi:Protein of unknown function (DUF3500)
MEFSMKRKIVLLSVCLLIVLVAGWVWQEARQQTQKINTKPAPPARTQPAKKNDTTGKTMEAALKLLSTLDDAGRAKVNFPFESEQKTKWSNFPSGIYQRNGLRMGDLNAAQREAVMNLLATALSKQ